MTTVTSKDCLTCGLCCVALADQPAYADTTPEDEKRLGVKFVRLNVIRPRTIDVLAAALDGPSLPYGAIRTRWHEVQKGPLAGKELCYCTALDGDVLKRVRCSVYTKRPEACRTAVVPNDRTCLALRKLYREFLKTQASR